MPKVPTRQKFLIRRGKSQLLAAGRWQEYRQEYLKLFHDRAHVKCQKQRRWQIHRELLQKYPEAQWLESIAIWNTKHHALTKAVKQKMVLAIRRRMPKNKVDTLKALIYERLRLHDEVREVRRAHRDRDQSVSILSDAAVKKRQAVERGLEKQMARAAKKETQQNEIERLAREALLPLRTIRVDEPPGPPDIVRDITWVYTNLGLLFSDDQGVTKVDPEILRQAPSNGAITMVEYALLDRKAFFEKFVMKILPSKNAERGVDESSEEEIQANLDPDFGGLDDYIKTLGGKQ